MGTTDTSFTVATAVSASIGDLVQIDGEIMVIQQSVANNTTVPVTRGSHATAAAAHAIQAGVYLLEKKIFILAFAQDFFGSPASGSYAFPITIPDVRIAAADLFMTNSRGNSSVAEESFTDTTDLGLRSLLGGQLTIQVEGPLAIQTNAAPPLLVETRAPSETFTQWCRTRLRGAGNHASDSEWCGLLRTYDRHWGHCIECRRWICARTVAGSGNHRAEHYVGGATANTAPGSDLTVTIRL